MTSALALAKRLHHGQGLLTLKVPVMLTAEMNGVGGGDMVSEDDGGDDGSLEVVVVLRLL